jgi:protein-disulfide isomerase
MSKRRELEARQQAEDRKRTLTLLGIIAGIAVVVIGGAIVLSNTLPDAGRRTVAPLLPAPNAVAAKLPPNADQFNRAWGPADAPIKVEEYVDYQCPACQAFYYAAEPKIVEGFANTGKVRYEVKFMPFLEDRVPGSRESRDAAQAALCAADQSKFWEMHATLFENQLITHEENVGNFSKDRLKQMATTIAGIDNAKFAACLDANTHEAKVAEIRAEGEKRGVQGTPTIFINGKSYYQDNRVTTVDGLRQIFAEIAPDVKFQ